VKGEQCVSLWLQARQEGVECFVTRPALRRQVMMLLLAAAAAAACCCLLLLADVY